MLVVVASTPSGFDWSRFHDTLRGYPFSRIEWLADQAGVDARWLWGCLGAEVERR